MTAVAAIRSLEDDHEPVLAAAPDAPEPNPIGAAHPRHARALEGGHGQARLLGAGLGVAGYLSGVQLYQSQAILRVFPQESNILYATGDDSVLKTFDSFVGGDELCRLAPGHVARG
jgi:hypothetical protein